MSFQTPLISLVIAMMIGNNLVTADSHGCTSSTGYEWCASLRKCLHVTVTCPQTCFNGQQWCVASASCYSPIGGYCESACPDGQEWCTSPRGCYYPIGGYCEDRGVSAAYKAPSAVLDEDDAFDEDSNETTSCNSLWEVCGGDDGRCCSGTQCICDASGTTDECGCIPTNFQTAQEQTSDTTQPPDADTTTLSPSAQNSGGSYLSRLMAMNLEPASSAESASNSGDDSSDISYLIAKNTVIQAKLVGVLNGNGFIVTAQCEFTTVDVYVDGNEYYSEVKIDCVLRTRTAKVRFDYDGFAVIESSKITNLEFVAWIN